MLSLPWMLNVLVWYIVWVTVTRLQLFSDMLHLSRFNLDWYLLFPSFCRVCPSFTCVIPHKLFNWSSLGILRKKRYIHYTSPSSVDYLCASEEISDGAIFCCRLMTTLSSELKKWAMIQLLSWNPCLGISKRRYFSITKTMPKWIDLLISLTQHFKLLNFIFLTHRTRIHRKVISSRSSVGSPYDQHIPKWGNHHLQSIEAGWPFCHNRSPFCQKKMSATKCNPDVGLGLCFWI